METKGVVATNINKKIKISTCFDENSTLNGVLPSHPTRFEGRTVAGQEEGYYVELICEIMKPLLEPVLRELVQVEVKNAIQTHFPTLLQTLRENKVMGEEEIKVDGIEKYKLVFLNELASIIFTNNEVKAKNGEALEVAIFDVTANAIVSEGLLSSARLHFFLLDGDHGSSPDQQQQHHHPLSPRDGKRPLIVGDDLNPTLQAGVASIHSLSITDNSSWIKSKTFRLGAEIKDDKIPPMFSHVRVAVSQPFRVLDNRGEVNKKHHPPSSEDEVWRLEGIRKDGPYHKNLTFHDIKNVGDFIKAYLEKGPVSLKKLLGNKVPKRTWEVMVANANECFNNLPEYQQTSKANEGPYRVMEDEKNNNNIGYGSSHFQGMNFVENYYECGLGCGDFSSLFIEEAPIPNTFEDFHKKKIEKKKRHFGGV